MSLVAAILLISLIASASARSIDTAGETANDDRIVNGENAAIGQFPHQVSLRIKGQNNHFCGGTIISSRWILTAAHCSYVSYKPVIVVGTTKLNSGGKLYALEKWYRHPLYTRNNMTSDIALWRTTEEIEFNENVQPAILPTKNIGGGLPLTMSGWGLTSVSTFNNQNNSINYH